MPASGRRFGIALVFMVAVISGGCLTTVFGGTPRYAEVDCEFTLSTAGSDSGPHLPDDLTVENVDDAEELARDVEEHVAWHDIEMESSESTSVYLGEVRVEANASGYVVHILEVSANTMTADGAAGSDGWSAHYFVNATSIARTTAITHQNASARSQGRTICA